MIDVTFKGRSLNFRLSVHENGDEKKKIYDDIEKKKNHGFTNNIVVTCRLSFFIFHHIFSFSSLRA